MIRLESIIRHDGAKVTPNQLLATKALEQRVATVVEDWQRDRSDLERMTFSLDIEWRAS